MDLEALVGPADVESSKQEEEALSGETIELLVNELVSAEDESEPRPPLPLPPVPARAASVKRFQEALTERGFPEKVAEVVARSVVDPNGARRELANPSTIRVQGRMALTVIRADVWTPTISPFPANPRESRFHHLPIEDAESTVFPPPEVLGTSSNVLTLRVGSPEAMARRQNRSADILRTLDDPLDDDICREGVLVPVMISALLIQHADGSPDVAGLFTEDGSRRTATTHGLLHITTSDATYVYSQSLRRLNGFLGDIRAAVERIHNGSTEDHPAVHALAAPAFIVIGCEGGDMRRAMQAYVGMQHVSRPQEWGATGETDAKIDAALTEIGDDGVPTHLISWFRGTMRSDEVAAYGVNTSFDQRTLEIVDCVRTHRTAAARGIRRVDRHVQRVRDRRLTEVSADLSLRSVRGRFLRDSEAKVAQQSMQEIIQRSFNLTWMVSNRTLPEIRDGALQELSDGINPGPSGCELALLAGYWLVSGNLLRPLFYHQLLSTQKADRRSPQAILYGMLETRRGIEQLYRVVDDARDGRTPRAVDDAGQVIPATHGIGPQQLTNDFLRVQIVAVEQEVDGTNDQPTPIGESPATVLTRAQFKFQKDVRSMSESLNELRSIRGGSDRPLIEQEGWPQETAEEIVRDLDVIRTTILQWQIVGRLWREQSVDMPREDEGENDS
jgi:hypothetical protein